MKQFCLLIPLLIAACAQAQNYTCQKTENGAKLTKDDQTVWELVIKTPEGKPYIHPLSLPDGKVITEIRPADHPWHCGLWFSWKYINSVNYWEPSDGETVVENSNVVIDGLSATATFKIIYRNKKAPQTIVLSEERTVIFSAPDQRGNYAIISKHHFTVGEKDITLDRTPPHKYGGGYAGLALRMNKSTMDYTATCSNGGTDMFSIREQPADWVDFRDSQSGYGIHFSVIKGTPETRFYMLKNQGKQYTFLNPCSVLSNPHSFAAGDSFDLEYKIELGEKSPEKAEINQ